VKFSQIAIYMPNHDKSKEDFFKIFGLPMYTDSLKMNGLFCGLTEEDIDLKLSFNHDIMDNVEVEYITSESPYHWHAKKIAANPGKPFLSHLGIYCSEEKFGSYYSKLQLMGFKILQDSISHCHSNKRKEDGDGPSSRHYRDAIFNTEDFIGFNIKLSSKV